jgi:hypothetical protein
LNEYRCSHVEIIPQRHLPIAEPEFTDSCACRIPPLPALKG